MEDTQFHKLQKGDWVETSMGVGTIVHFGRWNGKRWVRSARKRANGVYVYFDDGDEGYVSRSHIKQCLPAPPFGYTYKWEGPGRIITVREV